MLRPVHVIVWALRLSMPSMSEGTADRYAATMQAEAVEHGWDPFTYISLITYESGGNASALGDCDSAGKGCRAIGLAQIWAMFIGACRDDPDPNRSPGPSCLAVRSSLMDGSYNLRLLAGQLARQRRWCKSQTGRALLWNSLASQAGINHPRFKGAKCGMRQERNGKWRRIKLGRRTAKGLSRVINHRHMLIRKLKQRRKRRRKRSP